MSGCNYFRGVWSCKLGTKKDEPNAGNLAFASRSYEETVGNHNYFILEKQAQSFEGNKDHYSTSDEPNVVNRETDHYSSIEEPYQTVKDDYDYTTNALRNGPNTRKPYDIYNKLKTDRPGDLPGDYDHIGRLGNNMPQPGSDYDTSAFAQKIAGGDDYNHIPLRVSE
ncbi:hypothetical protein DPMN_078842 [Dreissena polymorpha]|uniref:Uncharacterized protein n=1 Tax=Dreissena polymorpha TaxID=45954 RepID=A0A9D3YSL8_DREPO|nr:hypothetical protein DPMN_078842 [Dreissena polymorpha]